MRDIHISGKHRIATKTKIKALTDTHINITTLIHTLREQRRISIKLQLELLRVICKVPGEMGNGLQCVCVVLFACSCERTKKWSNKNLSLNIHTLRALHCVYVCVF